MITDLEHFRSYIDNPSAWDIEYDQAMSDRMGWAANEIERAEAEKAELLCQLPDGMKHCTIQFKECEKGHGWLTATNWVEHGCPTCERDALRAELAAVQARREIITEDMPDDLFRLRDWAKVQALEADALRAELAAKSAQFVEVNGVLGLMNIEARRFGAELAAAREINDTLQVKLHQRAAELAAVAEWVDMAYERGLGNPEETAFQLDGDSKQIKALRAELAAVRETLTWYADSSHYHWSRENNDVPTFRDSGERARTALQVQPLPKG